MDGKITLKTNKSFFFNLIFLKRVLKIKNKERQWKRQVEIRRNKERGSSEKNSGNNKWDFPLGICKFKLYLRPAQPHPHPHAPLISNHSHTSLSLSLSLKKKKLLLSPKIHTLSQSLSLSLWVSRSSLKVSEGAPNNTVSSALFHTFLIFVKIFFFFEVCNEFRTLELHVVTMFWFLDRWSVTDSMETHSLSFAT